jgi:hypothetical protein
MPVQLFTEAERARRNRFPDVIAYEDLVTFFTLSERDLRSIPRAREPHNRLGYALQLCTLRFMGFVPDDLRSAPPDAVAFVAHQLAVEPHVLAAYGARAQTRQDHLLAVCQRLSKKGHFRWSKNPHPVGMTQVKAQVFSAARPSAFPEAERIRPSC